MRAPLVPGLSALVGAVLLMACATVSPPSSPESPAPAESPALAQAPVAAPKPVDRGFLIVRISNRDSSWTVQVQL
ncbi:MAG: hypothetical protein AAGA54_16145 [Myxococcota bacterium]